MNLISILPTSTYRLHMGCFFQFSRQTQQKSKLQPSHLTLLHPSVFRRFCPQWGQGLTWLIKKAKNPTELSIVILAHFSPHLSHKRQETGACPINPRHSQQKKCPCPQSTLCENLILYPAVVSLLLLLLPLSGT